MTHPLSRALLGALVLGAAALALPSAASAQRVNLNGTRFAVGGYDVVAYHVDHRPVRGAEAHAAEFGGATWLFASAEHRATFLENPGRYVPAYGGYCAYAMAQGRRARIDPNAWTVHRGRLYLNYSLDIRRRWLEDRDDYIRRANENWPRLRRN